MSRTARMAWSTTPLWSSAPLASMGPGVQLDGHHLAVHFLVHGDNVLITPTFSGADPRTIDYRVGRYGRR